MPIYAAKGKHHRAERRKIAKDIKKNTTRRQRRIIGKQTQQYKRRKK